MQKLVAGLHHFQATVVRSEREFFERMADGQTPEALFITCSDSRINPNLLTNTSPGELFILRNAGNIVPPWGDANSGEGATIEYAVTVLGVRDIIICGHSHCGAVQALIDPSQLHNLPATRQWLTHADRTRQVLTSNYAHLDGEALATVAVQENVLTQIENLRTHPSVATAFDQGTLRLHGWVYKITSGEVFAYDGQSGQYISLESEIPVDSQATARALLPSI